MQGGLDESNHSLSVIEKPRPVTAAILGALAVFMMGGMVFGFNSLVSSSQQ